MIYLRDVLRILPRSQTIKVYDEYGTLLFFNQVWANDDKYMLSCPVTELDRRFNIVYITISYL